jgi:hypothetical protein
MAYSGWLARLSGYFRRAAPAQEVPLHWQHYAAGVAQQLQRRLAQDDTQMLALHSYLHQHLATQTTAQQVLRVRIEIWLGHDGRVLRVVCEPLGSAQAEHLLQHILMQPMMRVPPADMPLPLYLQVSLALTPQRGWLDGLGSDRSGAA